MVVAVVGEARKETMEDEVHTGRTQRSSAGGMYVPTWIYIMMFFLVSIQQN